MSARSALFSALLFLNLYGLNGSERGSSAPYISGDTFREYCNFAYDELSKNFDPSAVNFGDAIFVKTDEINEFFSEIHPLISSPYVLVTHNSDDPIPGNCACYLEDEKIIAWFGQNVENYAHPKLHPIPIGIANRCWPHGNAEIFKALEPIGSEKERDILLYMNFAVGTHYEERSLVAKMFCDKHFCVVEARKELSAYLLDLTRSIFVLSPRGNGIDCHRTWESLLMGAIPIVKTSSLDTMYEHLPVVIVQDWSEIDEIFLYEKYEELKAKQFQTEKKYIGYWLKLIETFKSKKEEL